MLQYKFQAAFKDLNQLVQFYRSEIKKTESHAMSTIASMGTKGMITSNPDNTITVTWFFRKKSKYNKFIDSYLSFSFEPNFDFKQTRKTYSQLVFSE